MIHQRTTKGIQLHKPTVCIDCGKYLSAGITVREVFNEDENSIGFKCYRSCQAKPDAVNVQVIVDETAQNSLEFILKLKKLGELQRPADGIYIIQGIQKSIMDLTSQYPSAVIKADVV